MTTIHFNGFDYDTTQFSLETQQAIRTLELLNADHDKYQFEIFKIATARQFLSTDIQGRLEAHFAEKAAAERQVDEAANDA